MGLVSGSGAFWLRVAYETNRTHCGRMRLLKRLRRRELSDKAHAKVRKRKTSDVAFLVLVARLKKGNAKPQLTRSVREKATKKKIASWNAD